MNSNPAIALNTTVKSLDESGERIGGYLVIYGSPAQKDLTGEYFTPDTDFNLDWLERRPVLYQHGLDSLIGGDLIGVIDSIKADPVGLWAEAQLEKSSRYWSAVRDLVRRGVLAWSSGTLPNLRDVAADGQIKRWAIIEGSLTPTPAEPRQTHVTLQNSQPLAAAFKSLNLALPSARIEWPDETPAQRIGPNADGRRLAIPFDDKEETVSPITLDEFKQAIREEIQAQSQSAQPASETKSLVAAPSLPGRGRLPAPQPETPATRIEVLRATRYSHLSAADMSFLAEIGPALSGWNPDQAFYRELADKTLKAVNTGELPYEAADGLIRKYGPSFKANELDTTGQAGFGNEWAPDSWRAELWLRTRQDNVVAPLFQMVEMPTNPYELPIESSDPTVYFVPETSDQAQQVFTATNPIPQTKAGTAKQQLKAVKLALRLAWSGELNEDSVAPIVANYRRQAIRAMQNAIDNVLINGDTVTTANTNVNLIDSTPPANSKYLAFNGLRKYCLVTNPAQSKNAAGTPTVPLMRQGRFLLNGAYALRPRDCAWIVDDLAYAKLLSLPEFATMDKAGALATNLTGQVGVLDGVPVFASAEMGLSQSTDGKISNTGSNNTRGQAIIVFRPNWILGYRRQVQAMLEYESAWDAYHLTVTARLHLIAFDNQSASELFGLIV